MDPRLSSLERAITSDQSVEAFQTLVLLKKDVIAALHDEYDYAQRECEIISEFNSLYPVIDSEGNISRGSSARSIESTRFNSNRIHGGNYADLADKGRKLIKWQSPEFQKLEMRWKSQLNRSIECITAKLARERRQSVSMDEVEAIYESISQLQNIYYQVVEERENNNKLWLRLKMYSATRRDTLAKACKPYAIVRNTASDAKSGKVDKCDFSYVGPSSKTRDIRGGGGSDNGNTKELYGQTSAESSSDYSTHVQISITESVDTSDQALSDRTVDDTKKDAACSTIPDFINQMKSTTQFYAMTRNVYIQYSAGSMSYKVFNNIIDFLLRSLGAVSVDRMAVKRIMKVYDIGLVSIIDFNTFVMMYWEIAHIIRNVIDLHHYIDITGIHAHNLKLRQHEESTFVDIEDVLIFKNKLHSGDSCTKYLAMEIDTGEMRVVDVITKSPKTPTFEQISMEVSRLSKLQARHLALYLAAYQDLNNIYVVSEYCEYGSLLNHIQIKRDTIYTMGFIHMVMTQVIEAILYIHCNNMVHGSLSIDKIMIPDTEYNNVKIRDLGMRGLLDTEVQGSALTWMHVAPEGIDGRLSHKSDIWSAGVILAFLVTGIMPEERMEYSEYKRAVENNLMGGRFFPRDDHLIDIVRQMISLDTTARPSAFDIITHPWYTRPRHVEDTPGYFKLIIQPINVLMRHKRLQNDVLRVLESQETFFVSRVRKIKNTIELLKKLRGDRLLVKDFKRMLEVEGLSSQVINNILVVVAFDEEEIRTADFINALARWRSGEIAFMWNRFKNMAKDEYYCMRRTEFSKFLGDARSRLLPRGEASRVCNALAVADTIHWTDFVRYFD